MLMTRLYFLEKKTAVILSISHFHRDINLWKSLVEQYYGKKSISCSRTACDIRVKGIIRVDWKTLQYFIYYYQFFCTWQYYLFFLNLLENYNFCFIYNFCNVQQLFILTITLVLASFIDLFSIVLIRPTNLKLNCRPQITHYFLMQTLCKWRKAHFPTTLLDL